MLLHFILNSSVENQLSQNVLDHTPFKPNLLPPR